MRIRCDAAINTIAPRTGSGRLWKNCAKKISVSAMATEVTIRAAGDDAPTMSLTAVCDIPPATGNPVRHAGRNVGGTERGELLLGVDVVAVFLRKASGDRDCV